MMFRLPMLWVLKLPLPPLRQLQRLLLSFPQMRFRLPLLRLLRLPLLPLRQLQRLLLKFPRMRLQLLLRPKRLRWPPLLQHLKPPPPLLPPMKLRLLWFQLPRPPPLPPRQLKLL